MSRTVKAVLMGTGIGLMGVLFHLTPWGAGLEESAGLTILFRLRGRIVPPPQVAIVAIDRRSAAELDLPLDPVKWPRSLHAGLIDTLNNAGAAVIAFDIIFHQPQDPENDKRMADALRRAGNVVLAQSLTREGIRVGDEHGNPALVVTIEQAVSPIPVLAEAAAGQAPFPLPKVPIKLSRFWLFKPEAGDVPTLPVMALQVYALPVLKDMAQLAGVENVVLSKKETAPEQPEHGLWARILCDKVREMRLVFRNNAGLADKIGRTLREKPSRSINAGDDRLFEILVKLYSDDDSRYLNFYGPAGTIPTFSYHRFVTENSRLPDLNGKAVFVGQTESTWPKAKDGFYSVYTGRDGIDLSGVEVAATAFANLLEDRGVTPLPQWIELGLFILFCLAAAFPGYYLGAGTAAIGMAALGGFYLLGAAHRFAVAGQWCPVVTPLFILLPSVYVACLLWKHRDVRRERTNMRTAAGYYLPDTVVNLLSQDIRQLQQVDRNVYGVCLMTDAAHYTTLSEAMAPEDLKTLMNRYYEAVFAPIKANSGLVVQVVGDAVLALWTAPGPDASLRYKACRAALGILHAVAHFNTTLPRQALPTRIGLSAGPIAIGNIGAMNHFEYRPVGDIVNTAERLEGLNKYLGTHILASGAMVAGLDDVDARYMGRFRFVGKSRPEDVYEIRTPPGNSGPIKETAAGLFAKGLCAFREGAWDEAVKKFEKMLDLDAADKTARFYLRQCRRFRTEAPDPQWQGIVEMKQK